MLASLESWQSSNELAGLLFGLPQLVELLQIQPEFRTGLTVRGKRYARGCTDERQRLKELERENRELKRANEILRKASAFFAQAELDRRPK